MLGDVNPWAYHPHPEVWVLIGGIAFLALYAVRVIGPKVVPAGTPIVTRRQKILFWFALAMTWFAADWPLHDIGEQYLYSAHMVQHLLLSFFAPPLFLLATPTWFARLILGDRTRVSRALRWLARPVAAAVVFNVVIIFQHWPAVVQYAVEPGTLNGPFHYLNHLLLFGTALLMWMPVCGPIPELQISRPVKMIYLFGQSVVPTIPAGWLTFANGPVYKIYDKPYRMWGISVINDQQSAGAIMKIFGGFYLWILITIIFFRWAKVMERTSRDDSQARHSHVRSDLTFESVTAEFERLGPPPPEPAAPTNPSER
jgi:putative membrane protein